MDAQRKVLGAVHWSPRSLFGEKGLKSSGAFARSGFLEGSIPGGKLVVPGL